MTDAITERLIKCYTGVVHDVMRGMGLRNFTLPHEIAPLPIKNGIATLPELPGLGVGLDWDMIGRATFAKV